MTNPAGARFERRLADYLATELGLPVDRRIRHGRKDRGDIAGVPHWVWEVKATRGIDLGGSMNEARQEAANAGDPYFVVVHNRRSHQLHRAYATVELWEFVHLLQAWLVAPTLPPRADGLEVVGGGLSRPGLSQP